MDVEIWYIVFCFAAGLAVYLWMRLVAKKSRKEAIKEAIETVQEHKEEIEEAAEFIEEVIEGGDKDD